MFEFVQDVEFWIYFHGEGEEYFLHYDYWTSVPPFYHVKREEVMIDIVVTKEIEISDDGCIEKEKYSYLGSYRRFFAMNEIRDELSYECIIPTLNYVSMLFLIL